MYIETYRCKMCGEKIPKAHVNDVVADIGLLEKREQSRHFCKNGDMGILEFIGFKKLDD